MIASVVNSGSLGRKVLLVNLTNRPPIRSFATSRVRTATMSSSSVTMFCPVVVAFA